MISQKEVAVYPNLGLFNNDSHDWGPIQQKWNGSLDTVPRPKAYPNPWQPPQRNSYKRHASYPGRKYDRLQRFRGRIVSNDLSCTCKCFAVGKRLLNIAGGLHVRIKHFSKYLEMISQQKATTLETQCKLYSRRTRFSGPFTSNTALPLEMNIEYY